MTRPIALSLSSSVQVRRDRNRRFLRRLLRSANFVAGSVILLVVVALALLAPVLTAFDPLALLPSERLKPPSDLHLFGTDDFGRDVFTRVLFGAQLSLQVGLLSVALASISGSALGVIA